ncbi:MAG: hypothetical protein R3362_11225, partial [Rhodothermales bacterium]|nr:hypothetical protein [Rhodothermales bacterium]
MRKLLPLALVAILAAAPALAQDISAEPLYGTVTLSAGFAPDPHNVEVQAGGGQQNPISGAGCAGWINAERPDVDLNYTAGAYPLTIGVLSDDDTTLLV